jgi:Tfp pilus assembly protein PilO
VTLTLDHRTKVLIAAFVMLVIAAGGWFLGVQPALGSAFDAFSQETTVRTQNTAAEARLAQLVEDQKSLPALEDRLGELKASVPATTDTSALIADLNAIASGAGVTVDRITVDDGTPYTAPGSDKAAADAATAPKIDPSVVPLTDARITSDNFVVVPVTVDVTGTLDGALAFVDGVQSGSRLFLVNRLTSVADADNGGDSSTVKATIAGFVYVLLQPQEAPATQG